MAEAFSSFLSTPPRSIVARVNKKARYAALRAGQALGRNVGSPGPAQLMSGVAAILAQKAARGSFRRLWDAEVSVYSQWGEDGILDFLCDALDLAKPRALELGVGNYTECNTRFLAEYRAASVVAVDGRGDLVSTVASLGLEWKTTILPLQEWITPFSVVDISARARKFMGGVDILSLDIDGNDYWVAEALDLSGVSVIVVEYNPVFGAGEPVTVPQDDQFDRTKAHYSWLYYGASIRAFVDLFAKAGFVFVGSNRVGNNAFFVREDLSPLIPFDLPDTNNLTSFVDWRVRESRDVDGALSYLTGSARELIIRELPLINTHTQALTNLATMPST